MTSPFRFSVKDSYRQAVEAQTGGKNTVIYDDLGNPSIMVRIPRFNLSDVIDGAPNEPHPAFVVNGVVRDEIMISKYQNIVNNGLAYSLPNQDPATYTTFDQARDYCKNKGEGWHLMTNAEWAAIALWCRKNGYEPRGNNYYGEDISAPYEKGVATYKYDDPERIGRVATGSGPASWSHDGTLAGIYDLNGNVWEWVDGLRLIDGKIWIFDDNDFTTENIKGDTTNWFDTGTFLDNTTAGNSNTDGGNVGGELQLDGQLDNPMYTTDPSTDEHYGYSDTLFENLSADTGFTVPEVLKHLALFPDGAGYNGDNVWARNYGERAAIRGGRWSYGSKAGLFSLNLDNRRSRSHSGIGFRSAFISL